MQGSEARAGTRERALRGALGRVQYSEGNRKLKRGLASVDYPGLLLSRPGPPVT